MQGTRVLRCDPPGPVSRGMVQPLDASLGGIEVVPGYRKSLERVCAVRGSRWRCSAMRLVTPLARSSRPRMMSAAESLAVLRCRFQTVDRTNFRHTERTRVGRPGALVGLSSSI